MELTHGLPPHCALLVHCTGPSTDASLGPPLLLDELP
jgi:hypothetical protein